MGGGGSARMRERKVEEQLIYKFQILFHFMGVRVACYFQDRLPRETDFIREAEMTGIV